MRIEPDETPPPRLGTIVGAVAVVVAGAVFLAPRVGLSLPECRLRAATGVPCPTCGSTRLLEALAAGDVAGAASANPLVFAGLLVIGLWAALSLAGRRLVLTGREKWWFAAFAVAAVAARWAYVVGGGGGGGAGG